MSYRCPKCGSADVTQVDAETAYCEECEHEGWAGAFEVES